MDKPSDIYDKILSSVNNLMQTMNADGNVDSGTNELKSAKAEAYKILLDIHHDIEADYESLKKNTEWDRFIIAFYGETNAGKSTIIEALRIMMQESTKVATQEKFLELQRKYNISEEAFDEIRIKILKIEDDINALEESLENINKEAVAKQEEENIVLQQLLTQLEEEKKNRNIIEKIIRFFIKSPLEKDVSDEKKKIKDIKEEYEKHKSEIDNNLGKSKNEYEAYKKQEAQMTEDCAMLNEYADGIIIGSGQSDYTKTNASYHFAYGGLEFDLIDVPGIEGNENIVKDSILEAVQKAHAVFYVTNKPTVPQTGDGKTGTLEKIQQHLGAQTEVWTIYNKRVNNPRQLNAELVTQEETVSLKDLNRVISGKLGREHYRGEIAVQGLPAFLSVAKCLTPGSKESRSRQKFLKQFSSNDIVDMTGFNSFINMFPDKIIGNWKQKIINSNYNKAVETLKSVVTSIKAIQDNSFKPMDKNISRINRELKSQLEDTVDGFVYGLQNIKNSIIEDFAANVRGEIYDVIESGVGNDTFKKNLERIISEQQNILDGEFSEKVNYRADELKKDIETIITRAETNMEQTISVYAEGLNIESLDLHVNIKSKSLKNNILGAIGGFVAMCMASGLVGFVLGAFALFWNGIKAVYGFFNSSYRKEQQRKSADENIRKVMEQLEEVIERNVQEINTKIYSLLPGIEDEIGKQLQMIKAVNKSLENSKNEFNDLIKITKEKIINE